MLHELNLPRGSKVAVPEVDQMLPSRDSQTHEMPAQSSPPMIQVDPTFDRPVRKPLPQPMPQAIDDQTTDLPPINRIQPPASAPITTPANPGGTKNSPVKKSQPNPSSDDAWIDGFAPASPRPESVPPRRAPAPVDEALPDPFRDDPQTRVTPERFSPSTQPSAGLRSTPPPGQKSFKAAGFERKN
jgi:hypothetical protein